MPTDRFREALVDDLMLAVGQLVRRLRADANPDQLSLSQFGTLTRLGRVGPMTTADLARSEGMTPQSMKAILAGLEEEGCVVRQNHPTDGRRILFRLTRKGHAERERNNLAKRDWLIRALAQLDSAEIGTIAAAVPLLRRLSELSNVPIEANAR